MTFNPGDRFRTYRVERLLGKGGVGEVYLMRHEVLDRYFAVKLVEKRRFDIDDEAKARFLREARVAAKIHHPSFVGVHDAGYDEATKHYYLVMDYLGGGDVASRLKKQNRFSIKAAAEITLAVAEALTELKNHGLVHRDVKPSNILYDMKGAAFLADPGIVREASADGHQLTETGFALGTPAYMPLEQILDSHKVDSRADIYALGVTLYEMLTGVCPDGELSPTKLLKKRVDGGRVPHIREINQAIPEDLADFIYRMTDPDVNKRVQTPEEVVAKMRALLGKSTETCKANGGGKSVWTARFMIGGLFAISMIAAAFLLRGARDSACQLSEADLAADRAAVAITELEPASSEPSAAMEVKTVYVTNVIDVTRTVVETNVLEEVTTVYVTNVVDVMPSALAKTNMVKFSGFSRFGADSALPDVDYDGCSLEPLIAEDIRAYLRFRKAKDSEAIEKRIKQYQRLVKTYGEAGFDGCYYTYGAMNRRIPANSYEVFRRGKLFDLLYLLERGRKDLLPRYFAAKRKAVESGLIQRRMNMNDFCALLSQAYGQNLFPFFVRYEIHVDRRSTKIKFGKLPTAEFIGR